MEIKVTFNIDSNGILNIEAMDQKNGLKGGIQVAIYYTHI